MDYDLWLRIGKRFPVRARRRGLGDRSASIDGGEDDTTLRDFWPERLTVSRRHGGRLVSPLLIRRYVRSPRAQRAVGRAVSAAYARARTAARLMCGLCGVVDLVAAARRATTSRRCSAISPTAAPTAAASSRTTASASAISGSRSSTSPTPGCSRCERRRAPPDLTTARSTTTSSCARSCARTGTRSRRAPTPR